MNRYDIRDIKSGLITASYIADAPMSHHSEWGLLERLKWEDEVTEEEKVEAIEVIEHEISPLIPADPNAEPPLDEVPAVIRKQYRLPQTYEVIITDITAEIEAENAKRTQIRTLKQRVKALANQEDLTNAEIKEALMKLIKAMLLNKDFD